jgi:hypothetical protein
MAKSKKSNRHQLEHRLIRIQKLTPTGPARSLYSLTNNPSTLHPPSPVLKIEKNFVEAVIYTIGVKGGKAVFVVCGGGVV